MNISACVEVSNMVMLCTGLFILSQISCAGDSGFRVTVG
jgi:hypothetical protein